MLGVIKNIGDQGFTKEKEWLKYFYIMLINKEKINIMLMMQLTKKLDQLARLYNETKDPKYKEEWYKLIKSLPVPEYMART